MAGSFERFQRDFELFANQQATEMAAVRTIFQSLLVSMFENHPTETTLLNDLRSNALATLGTPTPEEATDAGYQRTRELKTAMAEKFFDELRGIFPGLKTTARASN